MHRFFYSLFILPLLVFIPTAFCMAPLSLDSNTFFYANGADISWLTEQENDGMMFYNPDNKPMECMSLLKECGMNSVRFRVWVNHKTGWCNLNDLLTKAKRANKLGLKIMIDFHYSDNFADPQQQTIPLAWQNYTFDQLCLALKSHTKDVLTALKKNNIIPAWVQIGNEIRNGMLWPMAHLNDNTVNPTQAWQNFATLVAAGYDVTKKIFPTTNIIVHIDNAFDNHLPFFTQLKALGGKWDMIGLSHYPLLPPDSLSWTFMNSSALNNIICLHDSFHCPILFCEIGAMPQQEELSVQVIKDIKSKLDTLPFFRGFFYWEPQCYGNWKPNEYNDLGWESYQMGAFTDDGKPSQILLKLWE